MRFQDSEYAGMSRDELLELEAEIHDTAYRDANVFGREDLRIRSAEFWRVHRRPYKQDAYIRGYRKRRLFEMMELQAMSEKRVLDVGCGIGQHAVLCARYGAEVAGCDISPVAIDLAREIADINGVPDRCFFRLESVHRLSYESESFDVVLCNSVLHHIWKYDDALDEIYRVLKPGGRLYFAEGLRSNVLYRLLRNIKRAVTGERVKGDIDLELADVELYSERFACIHIEHYTLLSGIKTVIAGDYGSPLPVRGILWITESIDNVLLRMPFFQRMALEVVGYLEKGSSSLEL